jgi:CheY-like chemotaxis protein
VDENLEEICGCDAVILDIILPPATRDNPYRGVSVLRKLRQHCKHGVPVVVVTVVRNPHVIEALEELGVSAILRKPVRPSKLYEEVAKLLPGGESEVSR